MINDKQKTKENQFYKRKYQELHKQYRKMEKENADIITNINTINYYKYVKKNSFFKRIKYFNYNISLFIEEKKKKIIKEKDNKISILFFIHTWKELDCKKSTAIGGTTNYVIDLVDAFKDKAHIYIVTVVNQRYMLVRINKYKEIVYDLGINVKVKNFEQYDGDFYTRINSVIRELQIDLVHINHIIDFPLDLALIASQYRTITSIHDYTFLCPKYFMLDKDDKICTKPSYQNCCNCINNLTREEFNLRKQSINKILSVSEKVIFPNITVADKFQLFYTVNDIAIQEHGIFVKKFRSFKEYNHCYDVNNLNIAFVGSVDNHKGGAIVKKVIEKSPGNFKYHLFGFSNDKYFEKRNIKLINHGRYNKYDLPYLLRKNNIDLVLFLNQVEETFSYTLSEVVLAGIPSLAFNIGAIGNRIKKDKLGWVINITDNPSIIIDKIVDIFKNGSYNNIIESIKKYHFLTNEDYANIIFNYYLKNYIPREKNLYDHSKYLKQFWIYTIF